MPTRSSSPTSRTVSPLALVTLALTLVLAACGRPAAPVSVDESLNVTEVSAPSDTTLRVTFSGPAGNGATDSGNYTITGPEGERLEVVAAYRNADPAVITLATAPQEAVTYALNVRGVMPADGAGAAPRAMEAHFDGSPDKSPVLASAISLSHTTVLLTFIDRKHGEPAEMDRGSAETAAFYEISDPDLEVLAADLSADGTTVLLTTSPQQNVAYRVKVTNVFDRKQKAIIDPFHNVAPFGGIPAIDVTPPALRNVAVLDNTTLLLSFSEPLTESAADAARYAIGDLAGNPLAVTAAVPNAFGTQVTLTTQPQAEGSDYTLTVSGVEDRAGNAIDPNADSSTFTGGSRRTSPFDDNEAPKIANAGALSNTSVMVTFSEPVDTASAQNAAHYRISADLPDGALRSQATLIVQSATLDPGGTSVTLTTASQSDLAYTLDVIGVTDLAGNQIAPKDRLTGAANTATFKGIAPARGELVDSDGDGLSDDEEGRGWIVSVETLDGRTQRREVTSDPFDPDTDGDGVGDLDEKSYDADPRNADTDDDGIDDNAELNLYYSDPDDQDSDDDGLTDGLELFFKTSPIHADTDGDQIPDGDEVTTGNRDPRVADVPQLQIRVGDVALTLDERFSYTDSEGASKTLDSSTSTTLEQGSNRTYATSDSQTLTSTIEKSATIGVSYEFPKKFGVTAEASITATDTEEYNTTVSQESSRSANESYNRSVGRSQTIESSSEVQREVVDAAMRVTVNLGNLSDVSFSVTNIEITAIQQDPVERSRALPVATLVPSVEADGIRTPSYSIGPSGTASSIVFKNRDVFPSTIEALMKDPRGLVFRVANYDLTDENGRNFAFSSQEVNDRTASLTIDYGDGRVESHRVATYNGFDANGRARGVTMGYALGDILGFQHGVDYKTSILPGISSKQVLTEFGGVATDVASHQAWVIYTSAAGGDALANTVDFNDITLQAGDVYRFAFIKDEDEDGLTAREEYLYGSDDTLTDSDSDTLGDFFEVREGWSVVVVGKTEYRGYSDPRLTDSDGDGLSDVSERTHGTDARKRDTDEDGISDADEINGYAIRFKGDDNYTEGITTDPLDPDSDGDGIGDGFEAKIGGNPNANDADRFIDTDRDGLTDYEERTGYTVTVNGVSTTMTSSKYKPDSDNDGLPDLLEAILGSNPGTSVPAPSGSQSTADTDGDGLSDYDEFDPDNTVTFPGEKLRDFQARCADADWCAANFDLGDFSGARHGTSPLASDTDGDGLSDKFELDGWSIAVDGVNRAVTSDPLAINSDLDGWDDAQEYNSGSTSTDPRSDDTDGDGDNDDAEGRSSICSYGGCRDPRVKDQQVTVTYKSLTAWETCEIGNGGDLGTGDGEFYFSLNLMLPDGVVTRVTSTTNASLADNKSVTFSDTFAFIMKHSDTFHLQGFVQELDDGDADITYTWDKSYTGALATVTDIDLDGSNDGCDIGLRAAYTVD